MDAQPTEAQRRWMGLKFGMLLHFGINTYYDVEWSDGTLDPRKYNPVELDTDQWCAAAHEAGQRFVVITAKHHDGFCNWPTKHTDYSIKATPCRKDVLGELANSAQKKGLGLGFYYSLWDRRHDKGDDAAYADFMLGQLDELCTMYGPLVELWFDGAWEKIWPDRSGNSDEAWKQWTPEHFQKSWEQTMRPRWRWDSVYGEIKKRQPGAIVINNTTTHFPGRPLYPCDARPGEKATTGEPDCKVWTCDGREVYLPLQVETTLSQKGPKGFFESGSWFWHDWDHTVASRDQILDWLDKAEAKEAVLLLNCGIMASGRMRPEDELALRGLRG